MSSSNLLFLSFQGAALPESPGPPPGREISSRPMGGPASQHTDLRGDQPGDSEVDFT